MILQNVFLIKKIASKSGNKDTKIGQKSGNSFTDFYLKSGNVSVVITAFCLSRNIRPTMKFTE